jgi:hypothetical protein
MLEDVWVEAALLLALIGTGSKNGHAVAWTFPSEQILIRGLKEINLTSPFCGR